MEWREGDGVRWLEARLGSGRARAAFSTRLGGVSEGPFEGLNLGLSTGDAPGAVLENRLRIARALGRDADGVVMGHQVHGAAVRRHRRPQSPRFYAEAVRAGDEVDAHVTGSESLTPFVMVADCLPIALAGDRGVAVAHCGWRGLLAGILARAAAEVEARAAAVGPGIGPCCYEVGGEVRAAFGGIEGAIAGRAVDLATAARELLERAGVEAVEIAGVCTSCEPDLFFSHRRDGERTGRQGGFAWLANAANDEDAGAGSAAAGGPAG